MSNIISVDFHGDVLLAVENGGSMYVALRPIVTGIGLDWPSQYSRLRRDPILAEGVVMMTTPSAAGGPQQTLCLRLDLVNGWLFTIDERRVKDPQAREKVLTYKRECYRVLYDHFYGRAEAAIAVAAGTAEPAPALDPDGDENAKLCMIRETRLTWGIRAARQMWRKLALDMVPAMGDGAPGQDWGLDPAGDAIAGIGAFLAAAILHDGRSSVGAQELYTAYRGWCADAEVPPATQTRFGLEVRKRGILAVKSGSIRYLGIRLVDDFAPFPGRGASVIPLSPRSR